MAWVGVFAVAVIVLVGAVAGDDAPLEISDEAAALCLACAAFGSEGLQHLAPARPLTSREAQISGHIAFGWTNQDIATHLGLSVRTIETHLHHVFGKLGIHTRTQLALLLRVHPDP